MRVALKRLLLAMAGGYLVFLVLGGFLLRGCAEGNARGRLARALDAKVTIGSSSLSVWRGRLVMQDVVVVRDHGGALELTIDEVEVDLAGWGLAAFDRDVDRAEVHGARMTVSARGLADAARRERDPSSVHIDRLILDDASLALMPTALFPGLGRIETHVAHAEASDVQVSSAVSWLAGLRALDATISGPAGLSVGASFGHDTLSVSGSLFGSTPLTIPLSLPTLDPRAYELDQLRALATAIIKAGGKRLLGTIARDALLDQLGDLVE